MKRFREFPGSWSVLAISATLAMSCNDGSTPVMAQPGAVALPPTRLEPLPQPAVVPSPARAAEARGTCPWEHADEPSLKKVEAQTGIATGVDCSGRLGLRVDPFAHDQLNRYLPRAAANLERAVPEILALPVKPESIAMGEHYDDRDWKHLRVTMSENDSSAREWFRQLGLFQRASREELNGSIRVTAYPEATPFVTGPAKIEGRLAKLGQFSSAILHHSDQIRVLDVSPNDAYSSFRYDPIAKVASFDAGEFTKDYAGYLDMVSRYGRAQDRAPHVRISLAALSPVLDEAPLSRYRKAVGFIEKIAGELAGAQRIKQIMISRSKSTRTFLGYLSDGTLRIAFEDALGFDEIPVVRVRSCIEQIEKGDPSPGACR